MKKQASDRPAGAVASESEQVEITPTMIDAGMEVYMAHHPDTVFGHEFERRVVSQIFLAMRKAGFSAGKTTPTP